MPNYPVELSTESGTCPTELDISSGTTELDISPSQVTGYVDQTDSAVTQRVALSSRRTLPKLLRQMTGLPVTVSRAGDQAN